MAKKFRVKDLPKIKALKRGPIPRAVGGEEPSDDILQAFKRGGFESATEFYSLTSQVRLTKAGDAQRFKRWQMYDGTKEGLLKLPVAENIKERNAKKDEEAGREYERSKASLPEDAEEL